ncbi:MAG: SAM-dependent methyltransferase [Lachnospiraceae bacterium]|nr:SAM-dependent methyltransferase [Lachnospiraceae bacterium]
MDKLRDHIKKYTDENLDYIVISRPRDKKNQISKIKVRPVLIKGQLMFQETAYKGDQVLHKNYDRTGITDRVMGLMEKDYVQIEIATADVRVTGLVNRKGEVSLKTGNSLMRPRRDLEHNRTKNHILKEGTPVGFLIDLGLMTRDGRIVKSGYDKYKQINRFLEFIADIADRLPADREVNILDFGCGKSYLTFAVYYYLKELRGLDIRITGLDLKEDVIKKCNDLKDRYGYDKLEFICNDVASYEPDSTDDKGIDLMMTLHACDTATDYALYNAVRWGAKVILSVPCCQHEVNGQIDSKLLQPVIKYGIIKERMSALITDGVRAELLRSCGYDVQLLEFIDMEHTPKNILIRAVKREDASDGRLPADLTEMLAEMQIKPALYRLLIDNNNI